MSRKRWSPHAREFYIREYNGHLLGLGTHPGIVSDELFDLVWLVTPREILDQYLDETADIGKLVISHPTSPAIIGSFYQHITDTETLGIYMLKFNNPRKFLSAVKKEKYFRALFLSIILGDDWVDKTRADDYVAHGANVLVGNFGG